MTHGGGRTGTTQTGGEALVAALAAHGVDTVFGIPGTHNLGIYAALARREIRHVSPRHEQGAGYAADGYARSSGRAGVCLTTTGPGVLNAVTAAAQAYSDSVPVLFVSTGMPLAHPVRGDGTLHEVKDQHGVLNAVVKYSHRVTSIPEVPVAVAQAFADMYDGRRRPVHLEIPLDLLDESAALSPVAPIAVSRRMPRDADVDRAAAVLRKARRPLIIVGGGAADAADAVRRLAENTGAPVLTTVSGRGVVGSDHPLFVGSGLHLPMVAELAEASDVVVAVGTELAPADLWLGPLAGRYQLIRVDVDPVGVLANAVPEIAVVGDAAVAVDAICSRLQQAPRSEGRAADQTAQGWRERFRAEAGSAGATWAGLTDALSRVLGPSGVVVGDSTTACYYGLLPNLPAHAPRTFLYPAGLGTLGYGVPAAVGAKLARPDTPTVAVIGDGALMFTVAELAMAADLALPIPFIVVDNGGYGEIGSEMAQRGDPVHAVALGQPDFPALARALGCAAESVHDPAKLEQVLTAALDADGPTLVQIREENCGKPGGG